MFSCYLSRRSFKELVWLCSVGRLPKGDLVPLPATVLNNRGAMGVARWSER